MTQEPGTDTRSATDESNDEISLLELASVLLKRWRLVIGVPLLAALAGALISFVMPSKYTAMATFVPEVESEGFSLPSGLAVVMGQLGVSVPGIGGTDSPDFYVGVLESRTLRDQILVAQFADPRSDAVGDSAGLLEIFGIGGSNPTRRLEEGREKLAETTLLAADLETGVVSVSVETRYRDLSAAIANLYIDLVNRFNQGSPELSFQYERLQRQVAIEQEVFTTLRRSYEEARIQEVNDTPVITVIDHAVAPEERSSPKLVLNVVLAIIVGGVLGVFGAFGREYAERARTSDKQQYDEFTSRWADFKADLRSLVTRSGRRDA
jgi:uncharacterized protein involved in exopolysaccharide biosynthesis